MRRFWRLGLRARLMIIGATGVAVGLLIGGFAFYGALTYAVDRTLDHETLASAQDVAAMVDQDRLPDPVPVSGAQVIQIVDARQRVVGGSATADRLTPLLTAAELGRAVAGQPILVDAARLGQSGVLRVRALAAGPSAAPVSIIVGVQVEDVLATRRALRTALLITFPLLLAVLAAVAWRVIGWTLRPVEELRRGADLISGAGRDERLPVPTAADEIRALAETLNTMLDRLADARARQRSFVADAAHELRSPLTSIRTQLEVAEHLGEGGSLPADLMVDVRRLSGLVEDLLLLARSDADARGPAHPQPLDLRACVAAVAAAHEGERVPVVMAPGDPVTMTADPDELRRAVDNLVANAVRYAAGEVVLGVRQHGDHAVVTVDDDGPGIPEPERERVFERFTRLHAARDRDSGGSGLGLAIVRELVTRAGGTVRLDAGAGGRGLEARIELPIGSGDPPA